MYRIKCEYEILMTATSFNTTLNLYQYKITTSDEKMINPERDEQYVFVLEPGIQDFYNNTPQLVLYMEVLLNYSKSILSVFMIYKR